MKKEHELKVVSIRMVEDAPMLSETPLDAPDKIARFMADELRKYDRELFCILNLKTRSQVINMNIVAMGSLDRVIINPREVFKSAILSNAAAVILLHNHPSGKCNPSQQDMLITERLLECGKMLGIPVWDHIITGAKGEYFSFQENEIMPEGLEWTETAAENRGNYHKNKEAKR